MMMVLTITISAKKEKRDLLVKSVEGKDISALIDFDKNWIKFPDYKNRSEWNKIPEFQRKKYIKRGEKFLNYNWPAIPATTYQDFIRTGSREVMQRPYGERVKALETLVLAELMEGKGRFIDQIINGVWVVCEQTYWGLSAHLTMQKGGAGVPNVEDPTIDLGVGKLATDLAWTYYFFKDEFDKFNPLVSKRIVREIKHKVLVPFLTREDFWWQGFRTSFVNNWNPWCNYNVLNCAMLIEEDKETISKIVKKTMQSVDFFINYYHNDGGCEEGPSYWGHAGGKLFSYLQLLNEVTEGGVNLFDNQLVENIGNYIYKAYISDKYFINFADASFKIVPDARIVYSYGKLTGDKTMQQFGAYIAQKNSYDKKVHISKIEKSLRNLFITPELMNSEAKEPLLSNFWLPGTELAGARDKANSTKGFYFAAKGGYNQESHNHNDVGSFVLYYDGKPCFVDAGVGTYTQKTFSSRRYEIWTMQSQYHNLPVVNGVQQKNGHKFKAANCKFKNSSSKAFFSLELKNAYPESAGINSWQRSYMLRKGKKFVINDNFNLKLNNGENKLMFLTNSDVDLKKGYLVISIDEKTRVKMKYNSRILTPKVENIAMKDKKLIRSWPQGLKRIVFSMNGKLKKGKLNFEILPIK